MLTGIRLLPLFELLPTTMRTYLRRKVTDFSRRGQTWKPIYDIVSGFFSSFFFLDFFLLPSSDFLKGESDDGGRLEFVELRLTCSIRSLFSCLDCSAVLVGHEYRREKPLTWEPCCEEVLRLISWKVFGLSEPWTKKKLFSSVCQQKNLIFQTGGCERLRKNRYIT